ncbi:hypothetical protein O6H91_08G063500 [Diphasiastrum complanatum]|uniref:Uncharacterized protein n=1 Tax=Diphasiastrum complanatum TaxID=34168 RepID=A0ACC2CYB7_DIPCM|nr:hypothetical protein O6H91_08G063500 [Diphasiastrum complanatum]
MTARSWYPVSKFLLVCLLFIQTGAKFDWTPSPIQTVYSSRSDALHQLETFYRQNCDGSVGECNLDQEFLLDSDVHRRILAQQQNYISYGSISAGRVPCPPGSGRSYYTPNCNSARGPVNPYKRGCSAITRCRRDTG